MYAAETALQLALTEMNENLRDVYLEAYTYPETMEIICRRTAMELQAAFSAYLPEYTESDFYETDLGTGGMMRGFMARRCDQYFTLEKKIHRFLEMSLRVFRVPGRGSGTDSGLRGGVGRARRGETGDGRAVCVPLHDIRPEQKPPRELKEGTS